MQNIHPGHNTKEVMVCYTATLRVDYLQNFKFSFQKKIKRQSAQHSF